MEPHSLYDFPHQSGVRVRTCIPNSPNNATVAPFPVIVIFHIRRKLCAKAWQIALDSRYVVGCHPIGATCTHEDFRAPCFTNEEIAAAKTQLNAEQVAFDALSVEEQAAHTAAGGLAPVSCACRECGKPTDTTVSLGWSFGICGIATDSCSGTSPIKGGCYSSTSSGCDCSTLKTI